MFDALQDASCNFLGHHAAAAAAAVHFERERFLSSLSATPNNINYTSVDGNSVSVSFVMFDVLQVASWSCSWHRDIYSTCFGKVFVLQTQLTCQQLQDRWHP